MEHSAANASSVPTDGLAFHAGIDTSASKLVEVWGDTVDLQHLAWSVVLGVAISVGAFESGKAVLSHVVNDPAMVRAYAMLAGLGGCIAAGALSAVLFRPKRIVVDHTVDEADRFDVLARLADERGGIGSLADLPASTRVEMKELGLLELFAAYEASHRNGTRGEQ